MLRCLRFWPGENSTVFQESVKAVREHGLEPVLIDEGEPIEKGCVYVVESFDDSSYSLLRGKCRIIGPSVVLDHIQHGWPLPASIQPVFCMAMHGVVACFTQAGNKERREKLTELVKLMGGKVEGDFTKRVTHLVAGQVGSTKYHVARNLHLPVMLPSWVEVCWEESLVKRISSTDDTMLSPHLCPPFTGCTITVTGLDERSRMKVKELCQQNGGSYSGELTKDVCTHLLVSNKTSTKYKYAKQWKIYCVTPQWFHDSVDGGYCMSEEDYQVDGDGVRGVKRGGGKSGTTGVPEWAKELEEFKVPTVAEDEFLNGCKIYFCGFTEAQLDKLHRVVNLGGGMRYSKLNENVTHVVMGTKQPADMTAVKELDTSPNVVSAQWLIECCKDGEKKPESSYNCLDPEPSSTAQTNDRKRKLGGTLQSEPATKRPRVNQADDDNGDDDDVMDENDLMMQYQAAEFPSSPGTSNGGPPPGPTGGGVLGGKEVSVCRLFSEEDRRIATQVVRTHGGGKVTSPSQSVYHLVPLELTNQSVEDTSATLVTMIWLQRCIEAHSLINPSSHFLFQPLASPISDTTLADCVLAYSQFSDLEREHLVRFSKGLGAIVQDHFARYPAHGLLATTHLIIKQPSGDKYKFARKWDIPAVTDQWLFACAKAQAIISVEEYLVKETPPLKTNSEVQTQSTTSPHATTTDGRTELEASRQEMEQPVEEDGALPLSGVVVCISRKLASEEAQLRKMAIALGAEYRPKIDPSCTHFVFQGRATEAVRDREMKLAREGGCYTVSPQWITACSQANSRVQESDYPHTYNPKMALTGLSVQKQPLPLSQSRVNSKPDPPDSESDCAPSSQQQHHHQQLPSEKAVELNDDGGGGENGEPENRNRNDPSDAAWQLQQHLGEIKEAPKDQSKRRRSKRLMRKDSDDSVHPPPPSHRSPAASGKGRSQRLRRQRRKEEQLLDSQVSDSQLLQVTYDDPEGRREKAKLLARIEREEQMKAKGLSSKDITDSGAETNQAASIKLVLPALSEMESSTEQRPKDTQMKHGLAQSTTRGASSAAPELTLEQRQPVVNDRDLPPSTPVAPPLNVPIVTHSAQNMEVKHLYEDGSVQTRSRKQPAPRFLLSSLDQREKVDYGALIQELGGEYIDLDYFTTKCTHLVVGRASRTEKFLGACAAGKWILHKSYLEECRVARRFVKEDSHEWGVKITGKEVQGLEAAPKKWRLALNDKKGGAFEGWKVLLFAERNKLPGLKRLLEAGGAKVHSNITLAGLKDITHAFISISCFPKDGSLTLEKLVRHGVHCLKPDYIAEYLSKGVGIEMESLYINEVKPLLKR